MLPKILVFTPIYDGKEYCIDEFIGYAEKLSYPNMKHIFIDNSQTSDFSKKLEGKGLTVYRVDRGSNSREALARAQNFARRIALDEDYDYIFSLESDIMCQPDILQRLIKHGKDVVSGLYEIGELGKIRFPCITVAKFNETIGAFGTRLLAPEEWADYKDKGIKRVQAAGMGCCLIHKNAFSKVAFTYDARFGGHSDIYFFNDMFRLKIPVFVDTDVYCEHKNSKWIDVKDR